MRFGSTFETNFMSELLHILKPRKTLNKAFLKVKPNRAEIETFKTNLTQLLDGINDTESEEFHKNLVSDFLKNTYYSPNHFVNTKGRNDLVIHNGSNHASTVGVIIEAKKPTNKTEMLTRDNINVKAFQELVLYYLRERITLKNIEVKYLIATNINEWFIFDATLFDRLFAQNKSLVKQFNDFEAGRLADTKTDFFYKQIAEPFIATITHTVELAYFDIRDYDKPLHSHDKKDDIILIALFKLLSPEHLLKLPFVNDSNSLDKRFYGELLHIIGLTETKEGGKKIINRNKTGDRNTGSLLENAIIQLESLDKISRLENPSRFGANLQERLFNVGLELSITWVNRILFLKLLEAQLLTYHNGDKSYAFLSLEKIKDYDNLNSLFFQVLAQKLNERNQDVKTVFEKVPYLNSSLFEPTEIEHSTLFISQLRNDKNIPIFSATVLKDGLGKKRTGEMNPLDYLFEFLNAYDFAGDGSEEIQEDNKTLINASVLGLIFEKINGYKDGSFFTPGFITMYMCRETIRKAVVQKFNETKTWKCTDISSLYDKIEDRNEANQIVNSLKICDPAVGSGHFLVSALNELIAVKNDLKILSDRQGKRLKEYHFEVVNDELIITDEDGELFEYNPNNRESQRIQEALFHEKQTLIENCLFGVDINPNSVKICRLRLWIELLKNAFYKNETELETLPNIDINIKCGNSLISRFPLDADLKQALKNGSSKWNIDTYKIAVSTYRNAHNKEQKRDMERLINDIKTNFRSEISLNDPKLKKLSKLKGELFNLTNQAQLFEMSLKEKTDWDKNVKQLGAEIIKLETEIEEIKSNKIFEHAFEWRFEFPEVLNDDGEFVGFDVVIGNPPYLNIEKINSSFRSYYFNYYKSCQGRTDIYIPFIEKGIKMIKKHGILSFIIPNAYINQNYGEISRKMVISECNIIEILDLSEYFVFDEANVKNIILLIEKDKNKNVTLLKKTTHYSDFLTKEFQTHEINQNLFLELNKARFQTKPIFHFFKLKHKLEKNSILFGEIYLVAYGARLNHKAKNVGKEFYISEEFQNGFKPFVEGKDIERFYHNQTKWLNYKPNEHYNSMFPELFENEKLMFINVVKDNIRFTYDNNNLYNSHTVINCVRKDKLINSNHVSAKKAIINSNIAMCKIYDEKSVLGILNSKVINWYFKNFLSENLHFYPNDAKILPIPKVEKFPKQLESTVTKIISIKKQNPHSDTSYLENQIDQLVYQLYNLTEEEIKIVEGVE